MKQWPAAISATTTPSADPPVSERSSPWSKMRGTTVLRAKIRPVVYRSFLQETPVMARRKKRLRSERLEIRCSWFRSCAARYERVDPNLSISIDTMAQQVDDSLRQERLFAAPHQPVRRSRFIARVYRSLRHRGFIPSPGASTKSDFAWRWVQGPRTCCGLVDAANRYGWSARDC